MPKGIRRRIGYTSNEKYSKESCHWMKNIRKFVRMKISTRRGNDFTTVVGRGPLFVCLGVYPSPTRIALKRIATCKGRCGSSKPLGIYRTPFQPCLGLPLPHCCLHRSTLSCTVQECNVTTYVLSPSSWTFVFCAKLCSSNVRKSNDIIIN